MDIDFVQVYTVTVKSFSRIQFVRSQSKACLDPLHLHLESDVDVMAKRGNVEMNNFSPKYQLGLNHAGLGTLILKPALYRMS